MRLSSVRSAFRTSAGHHYLVVEDTPDHTVAVDDVGYSRRAQPEPAPDVVEPAYLPRRVAPEPEWSPDGVTEAPGPVDAVCADADDDCVMGGEILVVVAEPPDLDRASLSEGPWIKEKNDVPAPVLRECKPLARNRG